MTAITRKILDAAREAGYSRLTIRRAGDRDPQVRWADGVEVEAEYADAEPKGLNGFPAIWSAMDSLGLRAEGGVGHRYRINAHAPRKDTAPAPMEVELGTYELA